MKMVMGSESVHFDTSFTPRLRHENLRLLLGIVAAQGKLSLALLLDIVS